MIKYFVLEVLLVNISIMFDLLSVVIFVYVGKFGKVVFVVVVVLVFVL